MEEVIGVNHINKGEISRTRETPEIRWNELSQVTKSDLTEAITTTASEIIKCRENQLIGHAH